MRYLGFLRGINVGGNHMVKMTELKKILEDLKLEEVKTFIASGNICFETAAIDSGALKIKIEKELKHTFGFEIPVMLRSEQEITKMIKAEPFKKIKVTPETRLYVTFLAEKPAVELKKNYESPSNDFRILQVTDGEIFSVLVLSPTSRSVDSMNILEKKFGKNITTRNWNTIGLTLWRGQN